jgi:hypothetical protein
MELPSEGELGRFGFQILGHFDEPFRKFSQTSATALDLSNGPKRAAILHPKSAGFPHS